MILWLHDDCLASDPRLPEAPAIYVFDLPWIEQQQWTLKRIGFIYECLLELPVEIHIGDVTSNVLAFARHHNAGRIVTMSTPDPHLNQHIAGMRSVLPVDTIAPEPLLDLPTGTDLRRFSHYWKQAERALSQK